MVPSGGVSCLSLMEEAPTNLALPPDQGTCFGFQVHSAIPLHCLRDGEGSPLDVPVPREQVPTERLDPVSEWTEPPGQHAFARLYRAGDRYWLWSAGAGWTLIEPEAPRITLPLSGDPTLREELVWTIPAAVCLLYRQDLVLHAGAVEVDGRALLLVAAGRAGKSTLVAAFAQAGYRVLSEDVSCLRLGAHPAVIPGPAMVRLRPDVLSHLALPGARVLRETASRLTLALDPRRRGTSNPLPLHSVLVLEPSTDGFALERIPTAEAIRRLWSFTFRIPLDPWLAACFHQLADLASRVPILTFTRPLRFEELPATVEYLARG